MRVSLRILPAALLSAGALFPIVTAADFGPSKGEDRPTTEQLCGSLMDYSLAAESGGQSAKEMLEEQLRIQAQIAMAQKHLGRDSNLFEALRMRQIIKVRRYLVMRNSQQIADRLNYLFKRTLSDFYLTHFGLDLMRRLQSVKERLPAQGAVEELKKLRAEIRVKFGIRVLDELEKAKQGKGGKANLVFQVDHAVKKLSQETSRHAKGVAERFDEYQATFTYLRKLAISGESEETQKVARSLLYLIDDGETAEVNSEKMKLFTDSMAGILPENAKEKAADVLERLSPGYLLGGYFRSIGVTTMPAYPRVSEFYRLIERFQNIEIHRLKMLRNREFTDMLLASGVGPILLDAVTIFFKKVGFWPTSLSTKARAEIEAVLSKLPADLRDRQRENVLRFRAAVRDAGDAREFYFEIESIAHAYGSGADKLNAMLNRNAGTDELFMTMFARRIDLRDSWREMKEAARNDRVNGAIVYRRMLAAEQRAKGRDLSLETYSQEMTLARWFFRMMRPLLVGAAGTWAWHEFFSEPRSPEEKEEIGGRDREPRDDDWDDYRPDEDDDVYPPMGRPPGRRSPLEDVWGRRSTESEKEARERKERERREREQRPYPDDSWSTPGESRRPRPSRNGGRGPSSTYEGSYHHEHGLSPAELQDAEAFAEIVFTGIELLLKQFPEPKLEKGK